jgi:hypothetical protein
MGNRNVKKQNKRQWEGMTHGNGLLYGKPQLNVRVE